MVGINQQVNIKWLLDLGHTESEYFIGQALQETRFQMDEKNVAAQNAVQRCCLKSVPTFKLDKPFYLWIERLGMTIPLFAAYIAIDNWKELLKLGNR